MLSGVGAVPWLERADSDSDGADEFALGWNSLAGDAGAAVSKGAAGLSCPAGMVLDDGVCKTPRTVYVEAERVCPDVGYRVVTTVGELGTSHTCQKTVPAHCVGGKVLHEGKCRTASTDRRDAKWRCSQGTLVTTFVDPGYNYSCRITVSPPTCPNGETYRNGRCERQETYYKTRGYTWSCSQGVRVVSSGDHGVSFSCRIALSPPTCPDGESYRSGRCERQETYYKTRGYTWSCSQGTRVTTSGDYGVSYSCRIALSPPRCPAGESYRSGGCYERQTFYDSRPFSYSCPSGYTLRTSGLSRSCTKTETYRKQVCSYDPLVGRQCWWETRTRTLTAAVRQTCPAGYSPDGAGCTADAASTRWKRTGSTPTRYRYVPAAKSCPSGHSDNGTGCQADTASTRWKATGSTPARYRYVPAARSCPSGYSDNGTGCQADTATTRWKATGSAPVTYRTAAADRSCDPGFQWNATSGKCERTAYSNPAAPITVRYGRPPVVSCPDGYKPAGGGRCSKTALGEPTAAPTGAGCTDSLGALGAGTVTRKGTLGAGCVSLRKGNKQSPHWARRFTFQVAARSTATVAASSSAADVFVYVLSGSGSNVTVEASDDDSGAGTDAKVTGVALSPGTVYTVEVTTAAANATGSFALSVKIVLDKPPVRITGLADDTQTGQGDTTASNDFTVEPAAAKCTAVPSDAKVAVGKGAQRTVSLARQAPFSQKVTVTCTAAQRSPGTATATLAARQAISSLTIAAAGCKKATGGTADYTCMVPRGGTVAVAGTAQGPHSALSLSWSAAVGATIVSQTQAKTQTAAPGADPVVYSRRSTAKLSCTKTGTVTLTATAGAHKRTATIAVTCAAGSAVACDDPLGRLADGTLTRTGTVTADSACVTSHGVFGARHARRHTFTLGGRASMRIELAAIGAPPAALSPLMVVLDGHSTTGRLSARGFGSGPGSTARIFRTLPAGDYTIVAAGSYTGRRGATGPYRLAVTAAYASKVRIGGLTGITRTGTGTLSFARPFTVTPADATCRTDTAAATVAKGAKAGTRTLTARIAAPGSLKVTVTCSKAGHADATQTVTLAAKQAPVPEIHISGLTGAANTGIGTLSFARRFTVAPADASCRADSTAAMVAKGAKAADRTLTVRVAAPGSVKVTVTCSKAGHADAAQAVTLTAKLAVGIDSVGVRALSGGECRTAPKLPDGADAAYACTMATGGTLRLAADATATAAGVAVRWATAGGVTAASQQQHAAVAVVGPDRVTRFGRTAAVRLGCSRSGTAAATATLGGVSKTAHVTVTCEPPVRIFSLADTSAAGTGKVTVSTRFGVVPADARCHATPTGATVTGHSIQRTLTASIAAPGSIRATVTCTKPGHADAARTVALSASLPCSDHLGVLAPGAVTRSGTIRADTGCTSKARKSRDGVHYARRHTFELKRTAWVTVELASASTSRRALDTYVVLLEGYQPEGGGTVLGGNDNAETGRTGSRLSAVRLPAGRYTVEATTAEPGAHGRYDLAVSAVTLHGFGDAMHVVKGQQRRFHFSYRPTDAVLAITGTHNAAATLSASTGSAMITVTAPSAGRYSADLDIAVPRSGSDSGSHAAATLRASGTVCDTGQTVVVVGTSVCAADSGYRVTIRTPATGNQPARTVPSACTTRVPPRRWHLDTKAWPTNTDCNAAINAVKNSIRRRTRFYTFEIAAATADVTIRLSSDDRDTHLALWRGGTGPIVDGVPLVHINLGSTPAATNNDAWNTATSTGYLYLDGNATDSRIHATLAKGVYVISAATLTTPAATDRHTINIKVISPP